MPSGAVQMNAARQNQAQAHPEKADEGVTLQLNVDYHIKTDPHTEMEVTALQGKSSTGADHLATFGGGSRTLEGPIP